jgi:hypothetical protein
MLRQVADQLCRCPLPLVHEDGCDDEPHLLLAGQLRPQHRHAGGAGTAARLRPTSAVSGPDAATPCAAATAATTPTDAAAAVAAAAANCLSCQLDAQQKGCCFCAGELAASDQAVRRRVNPAAGGRLQKAGALQARHTGLAAAQAVV